ncbi:hypothetical protein MH171_001856 [Vibrio parahaemolyticus]|nr:hypothetical protein [Vibrio parahaemolyticus]ELA7254386.1 hypothetical protein [Vibrio parahaemolyticus]EMF1839555.1 hypothetical protein [Vibrio parahaemolyticus]
MVKFKKTILTITAICSSFSFAENNYVAVIQSNLYATENDTTEPPTEPPITPEPPTGIEFDKIAIGRDFTLATDTSKNLWVVGRNNSGQLGLGDTTDRSNWTKVTTVSNVSQINAGFNFSYIVSNGIAYSTGENGQGQLGLGSTTDRNTFTATGFEPHMVFTNANSDSVYFIRNMELYVVGDNDFGQLGTGDNADKKTIFATGMPASHAAISDKFGYVVSNGMLFSTGNSQEGGLGLGPSKLSTNTFTYTNFDAKLISVNENSAYAIDHSNKLYVVGENDFKQLGLGHSVNQFNFVDSRISGVKAVSGGFKSAYFIKNNDLYAIGFNISGVFGTGNSSNLDSWSIINPNVEYYSVGHYSAIAKNIDGTFKGAGNNGAGQLGLGDTTNRDSWTSLSKDTE